MLMKRALPWLALSVLAAALVLTWRGGADAAEGRPQAEAAAVGVGTQPAPLERGELRVPVTDLQSAALLESASATMAVAPRGALRGLLLDIEGQPLPGASLGLRRSDDPAARRAARADVAGYYEATDLEPGLWRLALQLAGPRQRNCQVNCGAVEVPAGGTAWRDVRLEGARNVCGVVRIAEEDGLVLTLLLRRAGDPEHVLAQAETVLDSALEQREAAREAAFARGALDATADDDPGDLAQGAVSGEFWFGGLAPDLYELEIRLDADGRLRLLRRVDLTRGDADLGLENLRVEDFLP